MDLRNKKKINKKRSGRLAERHLWLNFHNAKEIEKLEIQLAAPKVFTLGSDLELRIVNESMGFL